MGGSAFTHEEGRRSSSRGGDAQLRLLEHVPAVFWSTDRDLRVTMLLGGARDRFGLDPGEFVARELGESHMRALAGESIACESRIGTRTLDCRVSPMRGADGEIQGTIGIAVDVTERVEARRRESELEQEVSRLNKLESV